MAIPSDLQDPDRSSGAIGIGLGVALFTLFDRLLTKGVMKGKKQTKRDALFIVTQR